MLRGRHGLALLRPRVLRVQAGHEPDGMVGPHTTRPPAAAGGCETEGQSMPAPPPPGGGCNYGRRLAELDDATVNDLEEHEMIADGEKDSEMEWHLAVRPGEIAVSSTARRHRRRQPASRAASRTGQPAGRSPSATTTLRRPTRATALSAFSTPTLPEMATSTKVNAVKSALGAMTGSDFSAVNTAYAAAALRQTAPATSLKGQGGSAAGCARWAAYNALYTDGSSPFYSAFTNFLDGFIQGAIDGTGSFAGLSTADGRMEAVEKGVADQLATMMMLCALAGPAKDTTTGWDSAYSYYYGDTPSRAPYGRGNKRCANYGTCMEDGVTAKTNQAILAALTAGRAGAAAADSTITALVRDRRVQLMIIYYQASLRYMFKMDLDVAAGGSAAARQRPPGRGWAFWRNGRTSSRRPPWARTTTMSHRVAGLQHRQRVLRRLRHQPVSVATVLLPHEGHPRGNLPAGDHDRHGL